MSGADSKLLQDFSRVQLTVNGTTINTLRGGSGSPVLLLHGYPQTHVIWHRVAPALAEHFTVVCSDLRGYGDSGKPRSDKNHEAYSKRVMADDQLELMRALGFERFALVGHHRGARVARRLALDHSDSVSRLAILDIVPTETIYGRLNQERATTVWRYFFLVQPPDLPELRRPQPSSSASWSSAEPRTQPDPGSRRIQAVGVRTALRNDTDKECVKGS